MPRTLAFLVNLAFQSKIQLNAHRTELQRFFINCVYVAKLNSFKYVPGRGKFTMKLIKFKRQGPSIAGTFFPRLWEVPYHCVRTGICFYKIFLKIRYFSSNWLRLLSLPDLPSIRHHSGHRHLRDLIRGKSSWEYIRFGMHGIRVWSAVTALYSSAIAGHPMWDWLPGIPTLPSSVTPTGVAI